MPTGPQGPAGGGAAMPDGRMQEPGGWNRFRGDIVTGTGGKQIIIEDPSGNPVELFQPVLPQARMTQPTT